MPSPKLIKEDPMLHIVRRFLKIKKKDAYLVGGFIRDGFLNRKKENPDIDLAVEKGSINLAGDFAKYIRAGFVVLDREHGAARVVKKYKGINYTIDFTDLRGENLNEDLWHRDFTINAMALDLSKPDELIDPYGGRRDLRSKIIRVLDGNNFDEDPLRILRAFSLSSIFRFRIDEKTLELAKIKKEKLKGVSLERVRDELFKILQQDNSAKYLEELDKLKILSIIIPEIEVMRSVKQGPYHHLDVWNHTLETLRQLELSIREMWRNINMKAYLNEVISSDRKRLTLIKFGALLHDIGKPQSMKRQQGKIFFHGHERMGRDITRNICERLRLSNAEREALERMVLWHLRPGYLADSQVVTARAAFRFFRDTQKESVATLLISLADQRATQGPLTTPASRIRHEEVVRELINKYFRDQRKPKLVRLITGDDLISKLKLTPSPLFARILKEVEELQAAGEIKTKKEALEVARKIVKVE